MAFWNLDYVLYIIYFELIIVGNIISAVTIICMKYKMVNNIFKILKLYIFIINMFIVFINFNIYTKYI